MTTKSKYKGKTKRHTMLSGAAAGVLLSVLMSVLCAGGLASLAINGRIADSGIRFGVIFTQVLATMLGVVLASKLVEEKKALTGLVTCISYCAALIGITLLFFEGNFANLLTGILAVAISGAAAVLLCARGIRKNSVSASRRKRYSR